MKKTHGYYKGSLELNGFKTPFIVYATSGTHAATKALEGVKDYMNGAIINELEGPYQTLML